MTYVGPGQLRLTGVISHKRATVTAINLETGDIGGKQIRDGQYAFNISAEPGQPLELHYQVGKDVSDSTFFEAPPSNEALPTDAGAGEPPSDAAPSEAEPSDAAPSEAEPSDE